MAPITGTSCPTPDRQPHAVLDAPSRVLKARKIVALVGEERFARARRVLEVGCGSGVIARTLGEIGSPGLQVSAVDVADNRLVHDGYAFTQVDGTALPFADAAFDVVVTNHVIEHVGDATAQLHHLQEIRRVLARDGIVYFAVPNRWRLVEPHFRLPLLSWFPQRVADAYVRLFGGGTHYDCRPLGARTARVLFERSGFAWVDCTAEALRATLAIEFPRHRVARWLRTLLPRWAIAFGMPVMPTFVYLLTHGEPGPEASPGKGPP